MSSIKVVAISVLSLFFSQFALAGAVVSCSDATNKGSQDYGDAASEYGSACHSTDAWQKLGTEWDTDSINQPKDADNSTDDGVSWAVSSDGGNKWSDFSTNNELVRGEMVKFKFDVTRANTGNHQYDLLKSWVDWNQDNRWKNNRTEKIINTKWWKHKDSENKYDGRYADGKDKNYDLSNLRGRDIYNSTDTQRTFYSELVIPLTATLGNTWLRARVVCENSLTTYSDNYNLISTGYQHQGEVEDYKLKIVAAKKPKVTDVPEPSTLVIFALGLVALVSKRRVKR